MEDLLWFAAKLRERWMIAERGILGPPRVEGTVQEMRHLNIINCWTKDGVSWEPDPRHADIVVRTLGATQKVTTPLVKERLEDTEQGDDELSDTDATKLYQSVTMRVGYLAQDRPDLQRTVRELAKGMCKPTARHMTMLKRVGRYLCTTRELCS